MVEIRVGEEVWGVEWARVKEMGWGYLPNVNSSP